APTNDQIEQAVAVPVRSDRLGIAVMRGFDPFAAGFEFPWRAVNGVSVAAVVGNQVKIALHVADQQVKLAGAPPIDSEDGGGGAQIDVFALALQFHRRCEGALPLALEEIQLTGEAA